MAAALHNASELLSGGEGQRKSHTGASSSQIIVEGVGGDAGWHLTARSLNRRGRPDGTPAKDRNADPSLSRSVFHAAHLTAQ